MVRFPECACFVQPREYTHTDDPKLRQAQFDDGYNRTSPRAHRFESRRDVQYILGKDCYQYFRYIWHRNLIHAGSARFLWKQPEDGKEITARIIDGVVEYAVEDNAMETWRAIFTIGDLR